MSLTLTSEHLSVQQNSIGSLNNDNYIDIIIYKSRRQKTTFKVDRGLNLQSPPPWCCTLSIELLLMLEDITKNKGLSPTNLLCRWHKQVNIPEWSSIPWQLLTMTMTLILWLTNLEDKKKNSFRLTGVWTSNLLHPGTALYPLSYWYCSTKTKAYYLQINFDIDIDKWPFESEAEFPVDSWQWQWRWHYDSQISSSLVLHSIHWATAAAWKHY